MKTITLFRAYLEAEIEKDAWVIFRERQFFRIEVDDDFPAKQWRRYDRLSKKLAKEIHRRLERRMKDGVSSQAATIWGCRK